MDSFFERTGLSRQIVGIISRGGGTSLRDSLNALYRAVSLLVHPDKGLTSQGEAGKLLGAFNDLLSLSDSELIKQASIFTKGTEGEMIAAQLENRHANKVISRLQLENAQLQQRLELALGKDTIELAQLKSKYSESFSMLIDPFVCPDDLVVGHHITNCRQFGMLSRISWKQKAMIKDDIRKISITDNAVTVYYVDDHLTLWRKIIRCQYYDMTSLKVSNTRITQMANSRLELAREYGAKSWRRIGTLLGITMGINELEAGKPMTGAELLELVSSLGRHYKPYLEPSPQARDAPFCQLFVVDRTLNGLFKIRIVPYCSIIPPESKD